MSTPTAPRDDRPAEPGPVALVTRLLLTQLLAVVGVAAVIAVVFALAGWGTGPAVTGVPGAATSVAAAPRTQAVSPPAATTPTPTPTGTAPTPTAPATTPTSVTPASTDPAADRPRVDVLNQSAPGGTASTVADRVRARGWDVGRVDDFHGNVSTTTVYYPPGLRGSARELARELPGSLRLQPAFSTISDSRLTIILVD
jgi:hypothetical protein